MPATHRAALAALLCVSCAEAHVADARPVDFCRQFVSGEPYAMQTTATGECISWTLELGTDPRPSPDFVVTGPYYLQEFGGTRTPCAPPREPLDPSWTDGHPSGTASTTVDDDGVVHLVVHARVQLSRRAGYDPITRDVDVDATFVDDESIPLCERE